MPVTDGPEAFKALRSVNPSIRFCFMTGDTCPTTRAKLLKLGAMRVYEKPLPSVANVAQELWELATSSCDSIPSRCYEGMDATDPSGSSEESHSRDIRVKADFFQRICAPLLASISELTRRFANRDL
jgi:CheY-like chemotaxis protein